MDFRYTEIVGTPEHRAIKYRFTDEILIQPAIIDYKIEGGYAFGFRLPAYEASCENGKYSSTMLSLKGRFFIFNLNSEYYVELEQQQEFLEQIASLGLKQRLNFIELEHAVQTYQSRYKTFGFFNTCTELK